MRTRYGARPVSTTRATMPRAASRLASSSAALLVSYAATWMVYRFLAVAVADPESRRVADPESRRVADPESRRGAGLRTLSARALSRLAGLGRGSVSVRGCGFAACDLTGC